MNRVILILALLTFSFRLAAQKENNIWIVGSNLGIDFNSGRPVTFRTPDIHKAAGPATVCDAEGRLLFYTNGRRVWDRLNRLMPGGVIDDKNANGMQETVVVPFINDASRYYLFTFHDSAYIIRYSVIDMSLNNGYGDIVSSQKNVFLNSGMTRKMVAVAGEGCYVWLLAHKISSNQFVAYKISEDGVGGAVMSPTGAFGSLYSYGTGNMTVSKDGGKIAVASEEDRAVEMYDFDKATGIAGNAKLVDQFDLMGRAHSVCFSPNGSKLYAVGGPAGSGLWQYDLLQTAPPVQMDGTTNANGQLRLGPDNKIYVANMGGIHCIQYPDSAGHACGFNGGYVLMQDSLKPNSWSLGVDVIKLVRTSLSGRTSHRLCRGDSLKLNVPAGFSQFEWSDHDTSRQKIVNTDLHVTLTSARQCITRRDTFDIQTIDCNCNIWLPDAFTPNGDGKNDQFKPLGTEMSEAVLKIFDRWGQLVFFTANASKGWDGKFYGRDCELGNYHYLLQGKCVAGQVVNLKGSVLLIR